MVGLAGCFAYSLRYRRKRGEPRRGRCKSSRISLCGLESEYGLPSKLAAVAIALQSLPTDRLRYQQLMALASKLPPMPAEVKTPANKVPGCLSTVHVHATLQNDGTIRYQGDSDALISKGLVALLVNGLSDCTVDEIVAVKPEFIKASGITASLTPGRNNGFYNMFKLMTKQAQGLGTGDGRATPAERDQDHPLSSADIGLRIYNSMTRKKEPFRPLEAGVVRMYVCGVTVYDLCHLGHARIMVFFDVVARYLRYKGCSVMYLRNVTDIDDKIINRSRETGVPADELARHMEEEMRRDAESLGCEAPTLEPRVSESISAIISMVSTLQEKEHAYVASMDNAGGLDVYFRVKSVSSYGRLSRCSLDGNQAGARVDIGMEKESPEDFALWKTAKPGEPSWESPWGRGRPGWHIECSAMAKKHLGDTLDIHGGGPDLIFPHHENEIAQSEAANGKLYANTWMHCAAVRSTGDQKMSKSLGNFVTIREALKKYDGETIRMYFLSYQYRQPLLYSEDGLAQAHERLLRLYAALRGVPPTGAEAPGAIPDPEPWRCFHEAMANDFDTVTAIAVMTDVSKKLLQLQSLTEGAAAHAALGQQLRAMGALIGLLHRDPEEVLQGGFAGADFKARVDTLIAERAAARGARDFVRADEIKAKLTGMGVVMEDTAKGTTWRIGALVS